MLAPVLSDVEIIVHAFSRDDAGLQTRIDLFGSAISHVHVAGSGVEGVRYSPLEGEPQVGHQIRLLQDAGFAGSWTIEFTRGVGWGNENIEDLFKSACDDLEFLRSNLA